MARAHQKYPVHRVDGNELLGFVLSDGGGWAAQTLFGYTMERTSDRTTAEKIVRERGLQFLTGTWQYFDADDQNWHTCILKEVYEQRVVVIRTTEMGYQNPDDYKVVSIKDPSETNLIKN